MTTDDTFTCPQCRDTYRMHWLEPDDSGRCRSCAASLRGDCDSRYCDGHHDAHPCSGPLEDIGEPCRYCGRPCPFDGPCAHCWLTLDELPLADIKALFAGDDALSIGGLGSAAD